MTDELTSMIESPDKPGPRPGKLTVTCTEFREVERGTLRGFATIRIADMRLTIRDVAVHEKNGKRWAQLPAKPQIDKDRRLVTEQDGKIRYTKIMEFDSRVVADAFSEAVVRAVDARRARS